MDTNTLIDAYKNLQRLPVPTTAVAAMPSVAPPPPVPITPPVLPAAAGPIVTKEPDPVAQNMRTSLLGHQQELQRLNDTGSGISQIKNPFLRGLARVGDVAETILAPRAASFTPGTEMNHQRLVGQEYGRIGQDLGQHQERAQTALLDAQPQLKQQALENQTLRTQGTIQHQQDMLDLGQQKARQSYELNLRNHGYAVDESDPEGKKVRPLRYEEMSEQQQAVEDLKHAQQEQAEANAALKKAQNDPTSPAFRIAKERADVAARNAATAAGRLGLSAQTLQLNEDKFYNPQPTAGQRQKGDLAQSAIERVAEMREIVQKHPEWFGPGAGRAQNVQAAIGSQDPDMQTYMSAAQYLADHSAGVFGGRGQYITQALHGLTDPHYNPQALNAALDEAEKSAQGFVSAGKVHGKGESSGYGVETKSSPNAAPKAGDVVDGYKFKGGNPADQKNWVKQ